MQEQTQKLTPEQEAKLRKYRRILYISIAIITAINITILVIYANL